MFKFNIIKIGALYECKIVGTYQHRNDACEALDSFLDKHYKENKKNFKVYKEENGRYAVYDQGICWKSLEAVFYIIEFDDTNNSYLED